MASEGWETVRKMGVGRWVWELCWSMAWGEQPTEEEAIDLVQRKNSG